MNKNHTQNLLLLINILLPLLSGFYIYLFFSDNIYLFRFLQGVFCVSTVNFKSVFLSFMRNYMCDAFWAYSLFFSLKIFTDNSFTIVAICISMGTFFEILQNVDLIPGTFDVLDIIFELIAVFTALSVNKYFLKKGE